MNILRGIFDRIVLVVTVVAAGCIPSFITQYQQRVGGMLTQVLQDIAPFQAIANQFHEGSLQRLIRHHLDSSDPTFHSEGVAIQAMVDAAERLGRMSEALNTDLFSQVKYLFTYMDAAIACATWEMYTPSFSLSAESILLSAGVGMSAWLIFIVTWFVLARLIQFFIDRRNNQDKRSI